MQIQQNAWVCVLKSWQDRSPAIRSNTLSCTPVVASRGWQEPKGRCSGTWPSSSHTYSMHLERHHNHLRTSQLTPGGLSLYPSPRK